jgi:membrane associated rhomboid family serine protease
MLIVACCAVFLVDMLLPKVPVQASRWMVERTREQAFSDLQRAQVPLELRYFTPDQSGVGKMAAYPRGASIADPIAVADYMLVSPVRKWLQFTTAQAVASFDASGAFVGGEVWRFVGYGFLHVNLVHLAFNMLGLFMLGGLVEDHFGRSRYLAVFLLSVVMGAFLFLVLNALGLAWFAWKGEQFLLPGLLFNDPYLPLIGASGGVYGIILAAAWLRPNDDILVFYVLPVRFKHFALVLIGVSVVTLLQSGANAGGEAAHLGGAIAGWWVAQRPHLLDDFFDFLGRATPKGRAKHAGGASNAARRGPDTAEVDRILDKVREKGLQSLTERERETLRAATDASRGRKA